MKIIIHGPLAGPGWDGSPALKSWGPDQVVEVPDGNAKAVAWARGWVDTPHAELVEDVKEKETKAPAAGADVSAKASVKGSGRA